MTPKPPSARQLNYPNALALRTGQTFAMPRTRQDASAEIRRLKATPAESPIERMIEREIADAIAQGEKDAARFRQSEVTGYGSTATWSRRS